MTAERSIAFNSIFAIRRVSCSAHGFGANQSLVFQIIPNAIGSGKSPTLRVASKRYVPFND